MEEPQPQPNKFESLFESALWSTRFTVLLAVVCSLFGAVLMFIVGSITMFKQIGKLFEQGLTDKTALYLVGSLIGSIDLYLIGVVLLIFSFGLYELFISQIDVGRRNAEVKILEIRDLDELKNRIIKVVIMVLIVSFFKKVLGTTLETPLEMLYMAVAILLISLASYFMHKSH